jgi:hypothetical protein
MKIAQNTKVSIVFKKFLRTLDAKHSTLQKQKIFAIAMINVCKPIYFANI